MSVHETNDELCVSHEILKMLVQDQISLLDEIGRENYGN